MKTLFRFLKRYRTESILGPLFKLLEATLELFVPLVIADLIDRGISASDVPYSVKMCLLLVALGIVGLVFSVTAQYFAARAAVGTVGSMRKALFAHVGSLSYTELDSLGTSTLITRMTGDANQVQSGLNLALRLLLRSPFVVFGAMIMAFFVDAHAAVTFAVVIPALALVVFGIMLLCLPLYKKVQARLERVLGATRENLTGARVIRAFCKEEDEIAAFHEKNDALTSLQKFVGRISALLNPLTYVLINFATVWLIYIGALRVDLGQLTCGQVVALYNYMAQILVELIKLASLIITITRSIASAQRIQSVLDTRSSQDAPNEEPQPGDSDYAVEFCDVSLRYQNAGEESLTNLSLKVRHGETIGIIGGTGSGKSTLVGMIPRFYDATEGTVRVEGIDVKDRPIASLRRIIGIVEQKPVLFAASVRENLAWGRADATDEEMYLALEAAQARGVIEEKGGLDFKIEQGGRNLSGGQKQRLTIARALVRRPRILILDDAASALDFATDAALRTAIRNLPDRPTVFIVSQRASSIMYADRIVTLDDGHVVGIGTHEELMAGCEVYREIYESQFADQKKESEASES